MAEYRIDCTNKRLGRVASEIAVILQGKKSPLYNPRLLGNDKVVVINIDKLSVSGSKADQKVYFAHSGRIGHLKQRLFKNVVAQHGMQWVLRHAVMRMLPKNRLAARRIKNLIFE
jgi:large subunit ribosomal protein L13